MGKYDDIINLPHHESAKHPKMPALDRAAQFLPFAALTGYDAAVRETARLTDYRIELDEMKKEELRGSLQMLRERLAQKPEVIITYFVPDTRKEGGAYLSVRGTIKKIDEAGYRLIMDSGTVIPIEEIYEIESPVINQAEPPER
ncbi:MAG: YolD-like family protein [Bacteroides fragilis]|nr:YolD-like family protein [Bacteroides fragilis]